jgi:FAD/FMN-containing dehydrogenase
MWFGEMVEMQQHTGTMDQAARKRAGGSSAAEARLRRRLQGALHLPGEDGYDEQRKPLFPVIDPHPAMIVEAAGVADVRDAVLAARDHDLPFAVQATGHGTRVPSDGGVLLKTGGMASVLVDPDRRVARVGPGARWSQVLRAAAPFGLAPLSGSHDSVGVTGYTLGGGLGWLARKHGFAADSVLRAEVVTADGRHLTATRDQHSDLFWALRGGGGNFGVVTSLEFRLHPVAEVYAGTTYFAAERAAETLTRYRDWAAAAPDELSTAVLLTKVPDNPEIPEQVRGTPAVAVRAMYAGGAEDAERWLRPLREVAGPALHEGFSTRRFADTAMGGTAAKHLDLFEQLPDPVIGALVDAAQKPGSPVGTVEVRHWAGAMADPGPDAGPTGHRNTTFSVIIDANVPETADALRPHATGGSFLNFLGDTTRTHTAYTPANHRRLAEVKRAYDPDNLFSRNHNIPPAATTAALRGAVSGR